MNVKEEAFLLNSYCICLHDQGIGGNQSKGKILHSLRNAFRSESLRGEPVDRETSQSFRSKSLENLVHDDDLDKTVC